MGIERVGLVGLGEMAGLHSEVVRRLLPGVELVGLDECPAATRRAVSCGVVDRTLSELDELVALRPGAVHLLTPADSHASAAASLLDAGIDVLVSQPLAHSREAVRTIAAAASNSGAQVATGHDALFGAEWVAARAALGQGRIGRLREVDVTFRRSVPLPHDTEVVPWVVRRSANVLFGPVPQVFALVLDLVADVELEAVLTADVQQLPSGGGFVRCWDVVAASGDVRVRIGLAFDDAMAAFAVSLRGTLGEIHVDLDRSTCAVVQRSSASRELERCQQTMQHARALAAGGIRRIAGAAVSSASPALSPTAASVAASVEAFVQRLSTRTVDRRHSLGRAAAVVDLAEAVADRAGVLDPSDPEEIGSISVRGVTTPATASASHDLQPDVVVFGGTGFIGANLVRRLAAERAVRVVSRRPAEARRVFDGLHVDVVAGDLDDTEACLAAIDDEMTVVDLTCSGATTWNEHVRHDFTPMVRLTEALVARRIRRYVYASTLAVYDAGRNGDVITERTPVGVAALRGSPSARLKVMAEQHLEALHRTEGLPLVVARPGVVLGAERDPCNPGVAAWPYRNVCVHWGSGGNALPLVLVDDLADAFMRLVTVDGIDGQSFNLCADSGVTAHEYVAALIEASGEPIREEQRSPWRWYAASMVRWMMSPPGPQRGSAPRLAELAGRGFAAQFDCSKAKTMLGWTPEERHVEMLRRGVAEPAKEWLR